jgi:hypothetical protein
MVGVDPFENPRFVVSATFGEVVAEMTADVWVDGEIA